MSSPPPGYIRPSFFSISLQFAGINEDPLAGVLYLQRDVVLFTLFYTIIIAFVVYGSAGICTFISLAKRQLRLALFVLILFPLYGLFVNGLAAVAIGLIIHAIYSVAEFPIPLGTRRA